MDDPGVVAAVDDLFFLTKIEAAARNAGVPLAEARNARMLDERLAARAPRLVVLDLDGKACAPLDAVRRIKTDPRLERTRVIGFFSHVHVQLEQAALEAGCDFVIPRSRFSARLPEILRTGEP